MSSARNAKETVTCPVTVAAVKGSLINHKRRWTPRHWQEDRRLASVLSIGPPLLAVIWPNHCYYRTARQMSFGVISHNNFPITCPGGVRGERARCAPVGEIILMVYCQTDGRRQIHFRRSPFFSRKVAFLLQRRGAKSVAKSEMRTRRNAIWMAERENGPPHMCSNYIEIFPPCFYPRDANSRTL